MLDEAYDEYVRDPQVPDGMALYRDRPNVAVLRTFSKAYGLAGLRVGFLVGHPPVAAAVRKTMLPFTVNAVAQAAAIASLAAEAELLERVDAVVKERSRVREELLAQGWSVPPTEANFVWLRLDADTQDFAAVAAQAGVAVRPFGAEGARVSIGDHDANDAFLSVAGAYPRRAQLVRGATPLDPRSPLRAERCIGPGGDPLDPPLAASRRTPARRAPACGGPRLPGAGARCDSHEPPLAARYGCPGTPIGASRRAPTRRPVTGRLADAPVSR